MAIIEQNKMAVAAQVIPAPQKTVKLYPIKDAYLSKTNPFFPFGKYNTLTIKNSEDDTYKAIMAFDIPEISPTDWGNLIKASLTIYAMRAPKRDVHLILKYHQDDGWPEYGTTWAGQPVDYDGNIAKVVFPAGESKLVIDITNTFKLNGIDYTHYAFTLLEDPDYGEQTSQLDIGSRETASSGRAPTLSYTYAWYPENYDLAEFKAKFNVRRWEDYDLQTKLKVKNGQKDSNLMTFLKVKGYKDNKDLDVYIHPCPLVFDTKFRINFTVQQFKDSELYTTLKVKGFKESKDILIPDLKVRGSSSEKDLDVRFTVHSNNDINVKFSVPKYATSSNLPTRFIVKRNVPVTSSLAPGFDVKLKVKRYEDIKDLDVRFTPKYNLNDHLDVRLKVKGYKDNKDLQHVHIVRPNGEALYDIKFKVKGYDDFKDYIINFKTRGGNDLPVNFSTCYHDNVYCDVNFKVRPSWLSDFLVSFEVVEKKLEPYAFIM